MVSVITKSGQINEMTEDQLYAKLDSLMNDDAKEKEMNDFWAQILDPNSNLNAEITKENEEIRIQEKAAKKAQCPKCSGYGVLLAYSHRDHGRCYRCGGSGKR